MTFCHNVMPGSTNVIEIRLSRLSICRRRINSEVTQREANQKRAKCVTVTLKESRVIGVTLRDDTITL
jgi:hypothetical protein